MNDIPLLGARPSLPMGLSLVGVLMPNGKVGPLPLADLYLLVTLHALVSGRRVSTAGLAPLAVRIVGETLAARDQSSVPASPDPAPPAA